MANKKRKTYTKEEISLLVTFIMLFILVIVLLVVATTMKSGKKTQANIVFPILSEKTQSTMSLDLSKLKQDDIQEYVFKVTNFKNKTISKVKIKYSISIENVDSVKLSMYKNDSEEDLIPQNKKQIVLSGNKLPKNKKTEDVYKLIIRATKTPTEDEKITIKINS